MVVVSFVIAVKRVGFNVDTTGVARGLLAWKL